MANDSNMLQDRYIERLEQALQGIRDATTNAARNGKGDYQIILLVHGIALGALGDEYEIPKFDRAAKE
ncbi:MAG: hypothetical protein ACXABY_01260 [Candidatus Thorarchaeota archaeon]|jgi:hypothetical protein